MSDAKMPRDSWRVRVTVTLYDGEGHRETSWSEVTTAKHDFAIGEMGNEIERQAKRRLAQLVSRIGWPKTPRDSA